MGYWEEGVNEPKDQDGREAEAITTGFPYQWDTEHVRNVDPQSGDATPSLRWLKVPLRSEGMAAYAASRGRPVEQKMDAVMGLYPQHRWDEEMSPLSNWIEAVANDQVCGVGDVAAAIKRGGPGVAAFVHMLKPVTVRSW